VTDFLGNPFKSTDSDTRRTSRNVKMRWQMLI